MPSSRAPHYLIINRYDDECGYYQQFAENIDCRLSYITLPAGLKVIDGKLPNVSVVNELNLDAVTDAAHALIERQGAVDAIVGISEKDILMTAYLREDLGVPGWRPEFIRGFRDKPIMKELVRDGGLRVPDFMPLADGVTATEVARRLGLPVVLKPRQESGSKGVRIIRSTADLESALRSTTPDRFECEQYVPGDIYHVDGVRRSGAFHFVSASRYLNTCLDYHSRGIPLGSVVLDPGDLSSRLFGFAARCFDALGLVDGAFHLEVIEAEDGELVFLEVGLRPGGGEIAFIHRDKFGIDLFGEAFRVTLGLPPMNQSSEFSTPIGAGWVRVREPLPHPSRVTKRHSMLGVVPEVYAEVIPDVGEVFDGTGGFDHVGGRFRLRGPDQKTVEQAAWKVMQDYTIVGEPT